MQRGLALRRFHKRMLGTVECGRRYQKGTAVPTSEMKISKSAERGEGKERRVWCCCTLCDSREFSASPVFAIRPRSEREGDAPSRVASSRTLRLTPKATKRG